MGSDVRPQRPKNPGLLRSPEAIAGSREGPGSTSIASRPTTKAVAAPGQGGRQQTIFAFDERPAGIPVLMRRGGQRGGRRGRSKRRER